MNYQQLGKEINQLEMMLPRDFLSLTSTKTDWKLVWQQIKLISSGFKGVRFPSKEEHQQAWQKFQSLCSEVKLRQTQDQERYATNKAESARLRDIIITQAHRGRPPGQMGNLVMAIATGGLSGMTDDEKRELTVASNELKEAWSLFKQYKEKMLGKDKHEVFQVLREVQEELDQRWNNYKEHRERAFAQKRAEREQKQQEWRRKTEDRIRNNEEKRDYLRGKLAQRESHLADLYTKLSDARSDNYRTRVSEWISEEESRISELKDKIRNIGNWIEEDRDKLRY